MDGENSTFFLGAQDDDDDGDDYGGHGGRSFREENNLAPQQSFIFGADQFYDSSARLKTRELFFAPTYHDEDDNDTQSQNSNNNGPMIEDDNSSSAPPLIAQTLTTTKWGMVFRHWLLSSLLLPLYAVGLVTFTWRQAPKQLSKFQGCVVIASAMIFYGMLWTSLVMVAAYPNVRRVFPAQQAIFAFFVYLMCCFAESMLKNTHVGNYGDHYQNLSRPGRGENEGTGTDIALEYMTKDTDNSLNKTLTTVSGDKWTILSFLDTILFMSAPTRSKIRAVNIITFILSVTYATVVLALHLYFMLDVGDHSPSIIVYIIVETLLQTALCFIILYPLSQVAIRLSVRDKVARLFSEATTTVSGRGDHTFQLSTLQNVKAWQIIRDTLVRRYAFPTLYVDVVISAAFTLWVPLVVVGVMDFFFRSAITALALNAIILALLILGYLLVCVQLASKVQETLSNTDVLRWQEYHFLVSNIHDDDDQKKVAEMTRLTRILKRLAQLVDEGKENAVVFQVWGFALNRKMATFLGGVLVTLSSSVVVRAASKFTAAI